MYCCDCASNFVLLLTVDKHCTECLVQLSFCMRRVLRVVYCDCYLFTVWDTAGQERYSSVVSHYLHASDAVMLVYDVTSLESFERLQDYWLPFVRRHAPEGVKLLVVSTRLC
jgi:small GTP-binding protein